MPLKNKLNWKISGSDFFQGRRHRGVGGSKRKNGNKGKRKSFKAETISINIFFTIRIIVFLYKFKKTHEA